MPQVAYLSRRLTVTPGICLDSLVSDDHENVAFKLPEFLDEPPDKVKQHYASLQMSDLLQHNFNTKNILPKPTLEPQGKKPPLARSQAKLLPANQDSTTRGIILKCKYVKLPVYKGPHKRPGPISEIFRQRSAPKPNKEIGLTFEM